MRVSQSHKCQLVFDRQPDEPLEHPYSHPRICASLCNVVRVLVRVGAHASATIIATKKKIHKFEIQYYSHDVAHTQCLLLMLIHLHSISIYSHLHRLPGSKVTAIKCAQFTCTLQILC